MQANEVVVGGLSNGKDNIHFQVTISGQALVDHVDVTELKVVQRDTAKNQRVNDEDVDGLYEVLWEDNNTVNIKSGELKRVFGCS